MKIYGSISGISCYCFEVIGGMTADIIETKKKLDELQSKYDSISKTLIMLQESNRMLIKEILKNKSK